MSGPVGPADFLAGLSRAGVRAGARVMIHSSLSSFGRFEGGAEAVARTLGEAVGPSGLVMMPCFTYGREPFDPARSPTLDGAVAEAFRRLPGVQRSTHPTHSVAARGNGAAAAVRPHEPEDPFGEGSPLHRLATSGGSVLLLGVTHRADSLVHVAQSLARVPYLDRFRDAPVLQPDGSVRTVKARRAGCSRGFDREAEALDRGSLRGEARVGASRLRLHDAGRLLDAATSLLRADPLSLLCEDPACPSCGEARGMARAGEARH